jgi:sodium-dependent dicarboxylate transporter 2/3/5
MQRPGRKIGFWLGLAGFLAILLWGDFSPERPEAHRMAAIAVLMAIWWVTDAIPLAATALLPLVLFPLLGILPGKEVAPLYMNYVIFLFLGGFLIALAMERWNLHRRIALSIVSVIGSQPSRLVLGFMIATAFLSMWISNTATTIMMLAIAMAVIRQAEDSFGTVDTANLSAALLLGIAYSASIGGLATLVGTPPNLALVRIFDLSFPAAATAGDTLSFGQWMLFGVPLAVVLLAMVWGVLTQVVFRSPAHLALDPGVVTREKQKLGPLQYEEKVVGGVFAATAAMWVFRQDLQVGSVRLPGWSGLLPYGSGIDDGTIAIAMAATLFFIPARRQNETAAGHGSILDGDVFARVPWGIILLFGGGFALAKGFQTSGLSEWIGSHFADFEHAPTWVLVGAITAGITFLTELTSNTATTEMILPVLASISTAAHIHPLLLMIPAAVAASCAFMMPVATPPNAIVFGSGRIHISQMVKAGLLINLGGIVVVTILFLTLGITVFRIDPSSLPAWASAAG